MEGFDRECIQVFLDKQLQLFDERIANTPEEAREFLEDNMAVVLDGLKEVRDYMEESGMDVSEPEELKEASEVFALSKGRYLVVLA